MKSIQVVVSLIVYILVTDFALARPEYAAKHRITRCTACHASPVGGGPKTLEGKQYGARNFGLSSFSSQEKFSLDYRALYYRPEGGNVNKGGMGSMAAVAAANIPVSQRGGKELRLVSSFNLGLYKSGLREAYALWKIRQGNSLFPQYIAVGRLHAPFGLLSDEHRTYVRMQTNTTWNDFEMGVMFSGNPFESLHYDLFFVNGNKTAGGSPSSGRAETFGTIFNLRFTPVFPVVVGLSASSHDEKTISTVNGELKETALVPLTAQSAYLIVPFNRFVSEDLPLWVSLEYSRAQNWNGNTQFISYLTSGTSYDTQIANANSAGVYAKVGYDVTDRLTLLYKYDELLLDENFSGDYFRRHGLGVDHWVDANTAVKFRFESAEATPAGQSEGEKGRAALGSFFAILQVQI